MRTVTNIAREARQQNKSRTARQTETTFSVSDDGILTVRIPLAATLKDSASGKSYMLAGSGGFKSTGCDWLDKEPIINFNVIAYKR